MPKHLAWACTEGGSWRGCAQRVITALLLAVLLAAATNERRKLYRHAQNAFASLYYNSDTRLLGRSEVVHPSPRCCTDFDCTNPRTGRVAVITTLRDAEYVPLFQQLECR